MVKPDVPPHLWLSLTHIVRDSSGQAIGLLYYDPGLDGYDVLPWSMGLRPLIFKRSLQEVIANCEAFQYTVEPV